MRRAGWRVAEGFDVTLELSSQTAVGAGSQERRAALAGACFATLVVLALWIATRPYEGYLRDAELYLAQALYRLDPAEFGGDLFFSYGSQDRYSVASALYAPLVAAFGPARAHLLAALLGQVLWLLGLWRFVAALGEGGRRGLASAVAAVALVPIYKYGALQYGEAVATPRVYVEAFSLMALAFALRGRGVAAWVALGIALPLHPVMTLPTVALVLVLMVPLRVVVLLGIAGAVALLGLGWWGVDPFARAFARMDAEWFAIVALRTPSAFVSYGFLSSLVAWALPVLAAVVVALRGEGAARRIARAVLVVGPTLLAVAWLGGDVAANLLAMNLQLWRGMWLLVFVGNCLVPLAFLSLPVGGQVRWLLLAAAAANVVEARVGLGTLPVASIALTLAAAAGWAAETAHRPSVGKVARIGSSGLAALATLLFLAEMAAIILQPQGAARKAFLMRAGLVLAGGGLGLAVAAGRFRADARAVCAALVLVLLSSALWDARSARMRFLTGDAPIDPAFEAALRGQTVYWEDGLNFVWQRLRQPSYFSCNQVAGAMFFRDTALEHARRAAVLRGLNTVDFGFSEPGLCPKRADVTFEGPTSAAQLAAVCRKLPELDALVLRADLAAVPHLRWQPGFDIPASGIPTLPDDYDPQYIAGKPQGSFNLYRCADLR